MSGSWSPPPSVEDDHGIAATPGEYGEAPGADSATPVPAESTATIEPPSTINNNADTLEAFLHTAYQGTFPEDSGFDTSVSDALNAIELSPVLSQALGPTDLLPAPPTTVNPEEELTPEMFQFHWEQAMADLDVSSGEPQGGGLSEGAENGMPSSDSTGPPATLPPMNYLAIQTTAMAYTPLDMGGAGTYPIGQPSPFGMHGVATFISSGYPLSQGIFYGPHPGLNSGPPSYSPVSPLGTALGAGTNYSTLAQVASIMPMSIGNTFQAPEELIIPWVFTESETEALAGGTLSPQDTMLAYFNFRLSRKPIDVVPFVDTLEQVDIADIPTEDMRCPHCWLPFGTIDEDGQATVSIRDLENLPELAARETLLRKLLPFYPGNADNDPVRTPCGHLFGRACLVESMEKMNTSCPICRQELMSATGRTRNGGSGPYGL